MPKQSRPPPIRNQLLAALPGAEYARLLPRLEPVALPFMGVLYEGGETIKHVYFPKQGNDISSAPTSFSESVFCL